MKLVVGFVLGVLTSIGAAFLLDFFRLTSQYEEIEPIAEPPAYQAAEWHPFGYEREMSVTT